MTLIFSIFGGLNRSFTPTLLTTVKGLTTIETTLLSVTRCWRRQVRGVWPPWIEGAWSCRKGRRWESLTWAPPSFCFLKPPKTLVSTCIRGSESEWARGSAASDCTRWDENTAKDVWISRTQTPRMPCAWWRAIAKPLSLSLCRLCLSSRNWSYKGSFIFFFDTLNETVVWMFAPPPHTHTINTGIYFLSTFMWLLTCNYE